MSKTLLKKIVLDVEGKEIVLTPEQAKKLHEALDELFGMKEKKEYVPYPYNPYPWYPYRLRWEYSRPYITYTGGGTTAGQLDAPCTMFCSNDSLSITL